VPLSRNVTRHKSFHPSAAKDLDGIGEKGALAILGHPKVTKKNVWWAARAAKQHGAGAMKPLLDHPKATRGNLDAVSEMAGIYGAQAVRPLLDHPKTTKRNFRSLARAADYEGIGPALEVWGHPKVTGENVREAAALAKRHGADAVRPLLDSLKTTEGKDKERNLKTGREAPHSF
jgi:hypothetical protein